MRQIALDTETTGIKTEDGHRIIEIGCIELVNRKFTGKNFHRYINPQRDIETEAMTVHGITQQFLADKPCFHEIAEELMGFIRGAELIIHNAPFDVGFINYELNQIEKKWKVLTDYCQIIDTLVMARKLHTGQRNNLDALCKRYHIDNSKREFHGALLDAHLLAQVYLAMTGGQGSLFEESAAAESQQAKLHATQVATAEKRNLIVIRANAEELVEHKRYMQEMVKMI